MERAILPASYPKCQWSRCGSSCSGSKKTMTTRRIANAISTITIRNDGKRFGRDVSVDRAGLREGGKGVEISVRTDSKAWRNKDTECDFVYRHEHASMR